MTETLTPEQKQTLLAATPKYVKAGLTPKFDFRRNPYTRHVAMFFNGVIVEDEELAAAAVIAWAYELIDYLHSKYYAHSFLQPTRWSMHAVDNDGKLVCEVSGESVNKLAASVALISAVAEGLGEG